MPFFKMEAQSIRSWQRLGILLMLGLCLTTAFGCQPTLSVSRKVSLSPNDIKSIELDPVASDQTIKVSAKAEHPFHLHVYLLEDEGSIDAEIASGKDPSKALAGARDQDSHSVTAEIPAGKAGRIRLQAAGGESFDVDLSINN